MCGLMAATILKPTGRTIAIVDKGSSVGGRLATRRIGPGRADHGAQFMTVREVAFKEHVEQWIQDGVVFKWSDGWTAGHKPDGRPIQGPDGYPRYAVHGGFNQLAKHMAAQLQGDNVDIHVDTRLESVSVTEDGWQARAENGNQYLCRELVLTAPAPQSLALLRNGPTPLSVHDQQVLESLRYEPCLTGLFWLEGDIDLPEPGAMPRPGGIISCISDNQRKGISPEATLVTIHATANYSRQHYEDPDDVALPPIREAMEPYLAPGTRIQEGQLKRWRYAQPEVLHRDRYLLAANVPPLYFGGDIFGGARVEGAALSGMAIGEAIARP
jgi:hypothetical protein